MSTHRATPDSVAMLSTVVSLVRAHPGIHTRALRTALMAATDANKHRVHDAITSAHEHGLIRITKGMRNTVHYWANDNDNNDNDGNGFNT